MSPSFRVVMIAVFAAVFLPACDEAPPPAKPSAGAAGPAKPASPSAQVPANMVAAVSASKTSSLIGMHFALESAPAVGKPLAVNLAIVPHQDFAALRVLFETPESVILATGERFEAPADIKAESLFSHKVVVQPTQEGVYLITAAVETESGEGTVTRLYSIPVIVYGATADRAPDTAPATTPPAS